MPAASGAHLGQGHLVMAAGVFDVPQVRSVTVTAGEREGLGFFGVVTIHGITFQAECVRVVDIAETSHFVELGWRDFGGETYRLWVSGTPGITRFALYRVMGDTGDACGPYESLGGVAVGLGAGAVLV